MRYEKSCGAVVYTRVGTEIRYLLIANKGGIYGFPKGHVEGKETEIETALREVCEETNLKIDLDPKFRAVDEYPLAKKRNTLRQIVYFLGYFENQNIVFQKEELSGAYLVDFKEAERRIQFDSTRKILKMANDYLAKSTND